MIRSVRILMSWQKTLSIGLGNYIVDDNLHLTDIETVDTCKKLHGSEHHKQRVSAASFHQNGSS